MFRVSSKFKSTLATTVQAPSSATSAADALAAGRGRAGHRPGRHCVFREPLDFLMIQRQQPIELSRVGRRASTSRKP